MTTAQQEPFSALLESALQLAAAAVTGLTVGEAWLNSAGSGFSLSAFYTPTPLVVSSAGAAGEPGQRTLDVQLARAFTSKHQLSTRLVAAAAASGSVQTSTDMSGDDLLQKLTFGVDTACAVPIMSSSVAAAAGGAAGSASAAAASSSGAKPPSCLAVLVLYTCFRESKVRLRGGQPMLQAPAAAVSLLRTCALPSPSLCPSPSR